MTAGTPGIDFPETREPVDVQASSRGDALTSFVETSGDGEVLVTVAVDRSGRRVRLEVGEDVQLVWKGPEGLRARPAQLLEVLMGDEPKWRLEPTGPAGRGQRRNAVRAPMSLPVEMAVEGVRLTGETVDVSEAGLRCLFTPAAGGDAVHPEVGAVVDVVLTLSMKESIRSKAEVVRPHQRTDERVELSLRFIGLPEPDGDLIRVEVFGQLRQLRARGVL
ncbi:PilZ domain-containing protein [Geodermatophilus marinus]|uniref:PilZ domain-containing protein n=1 Tax=Geodermatophilus sp. LHW52908 TaxID=2303986 RepID=UPI000E3E6AC4|nr:PilZ domain-containing protein [Geodermatophilus sp. LHW52908]RFU20246.1 PilZ domain-containing protein [Geodermatophilus sp. LHW52908]